MDYVIKISLGASLLSEVNFKKMLKKNNSMRKKAT